MKITDGFLFFFLKERRGLCSALILDKTEPPPEKPLVIGSKARREGIANKKRNNDRKTKGQKKDQGNIAVEEKKRQKQDGEWQVWQKIPKEQRSKTEKLRGILLASSKDDEENDTIYSPQLATQ